MRLRFHRLPLLVSLAALSFGLCACPGTLDPAEFAYLATSQTGSEAGSETGGGTGCTAAAAAAVPTTIFQQTCGVADCHNPTTIANDQGLNVHGLDLDSPGVAGRLINIPSVEVPADDLISSTDPQNSYLLLKLMPNPPSGAQMPDLEAPLSAMEVACVQAWIDSVIAEAGAGPVDAAATDGGYGASETDGAASQDSTASGSDSGTDASSDARPDVAIDSGATVTLTVLNYKNWCSVTINGSPGSTNATLTGSVVSGSTATLVATPASTKFVIGKDPWFGVTQDDGGPAPGTDKGSGTTETTTATVVVTGQQCVSVCCGDAPNGTNCPTTNPCP